MPAPATPTRPLRRFGLATALWVFGIATSVLLVSVWGRAVSGDSETLTEAAGAVAESDWLAVQLAGWLAEEVADHSDLPVGETAAAVESVWNRPEAQAAVEDLVGQAVVAGLAPPGARVVIDPAASIRPLTGEITAGLAAAGVETSPAEVAAIIDGIDPVVAVAAPGETAGAVRRVRALLTRALLGAAVVMAVAAAAALALGEDRVATLRVLATRMALTGLGFAVLFHAGAWALDPAGGGAPFSRSGAVLLGSNTAPVWWLAAAAGGAALLIRLARMAQRAGAHSARASPAGSTRTTPPAQ